MRFKNLSAGDTFVLQYKGDTVENGAYTQKFRRWKVLKAYPYHVLCTCGVYRESFTYGEMIQHGIEYGYNPKIEKERARKTQWGKEWTEDQDWGE